MAAPAAYVFSVMIKSLMPKACTFGKPGLLEAFCMPIGMHYEKDLL
jgi:hypothetical protein